jgi:ribose 5-phosphate isomerase RpiB
MRPQSGRFERNFKKCWPDLGMEVLIWAIGPERVDYPDYGRAVAEMVAAGWRCPRHRHLRVWMVGYVITATMSRIIRAVLCQDHSCPPFREAQQHQCALHGALVIGPDVAEEIVRILVPRIMSADATISAWINPTSGS